MSLGKVLTTWHEFDVLVLLSRLNPPGAALARIPWVASRANERPFMDSFAHLERFRFGHADCGLRRSVARWEETVSLPRCFLHSSPRRNALTKFRGDLHLDDLHRWRGIRCGPYPHHP